MQAELQVVAMAEQVVMAEQGVVMPEEWEAREEAEELVV